jgi:phosphate-selective porin O/P
MPSLRRGTYAVTIALLAFVTGASAQGIPLRSGAMEVWINGRVQTQFNTTDVDDEPSTEIALRRVRLEAFVKVNDVVRGKIQPDFAGNRVTLRDAYLRIKLDTAFQVLAGQAHRPFSILEMTSSTRILPIERGVRIRGVSGAFDEYNLVSQLGYSDRDVGLQVLGSPAGAPLGLSYAAGYFNGPARAEAGAENTYQLAARLAVAPLPRVRVGAAWSSRDFATSEGLPGEEVDVTRGNAWEVDLEYGSYAPGVHFVGEVTYGDFNPHVGSRFLGAQGWLAWRSDTVSATISAVEPVLRVSYGDANVNDAGDESAGGTLLTPGVNLYLGGLNRIMFNYDLWNPLVGDTRRSFKAQFQLAF